MAAGAFPGTARSGGASLDHFVGAQHYRWGYRETERVRGLAVQDHLKFCRKLHREITRLVAAQNAIHIRGGATPRVYLVDSVGEQAAVSDKLRSHIYRGYVVTGRGQYDRR